MEDNFLKTKIGSQLRKMAITKIEKEIITTHDRESEKVIFTVKDGILNKEFKISDCWLRGKKGELKIVGLWYLPTDTGEITPNSSLAKLLNFYSCDVLQDMLNKTVSVYPDPKEYLVLIGCDCKEAELEKALS
jgi:hypothetical protein